MENKARTHPGLLSLTRAVLGWILPRFWLVLRAIFTIRGNRVPSKKRPGGIHKASQARAYPRPAPAVSTSWST